MSHLVNRPHFDPSCLPPRQQLDLHVKGAEFINLMQSQQTFGAKLDPIAREIHELYIKEELARRDDAGKPVYKIGDKPALYHWNDLSELYKNSNREQAANYPNLLRAAGCEFEEAKSTEAFEFSEQEIENLARMEHERWMQERRIKQPDHPDLLSWEKLTPEEKDKDIRAVKAIPRILEKVGLRLVRLS